MLTGYGRIITYDVKETLEVEDYQARHMEYYDVKSVAEGEIIKGLKNGYAREIDAEGTCKVGFWKPVDLCSNQDHTHIHENCQEDAIMKTAPIDQISVPWGKWVWYDIEGAEIVPEGFYIGK